MMCETMANIPVEEKSSYVLTEDMIDAAMNEQFAYQEDLESEEEPSSPEEIGDQDSQESHVEKIHETMEKVPTTNSQVNTETNCNVNNTSSSKTSQTGSLVSNTNKLSVLVIETGLDKNRSNCITSDGVHREQQNVNSELDRDRSVETNVTDCDSAKTVGQKECESKEDLTILKSILTDKGKDGIIDLCESEVEDYSEDDDVNEMEVIDDELKSVMETNLMAEIGMTIKKPVPEPQPNVDSSAPRISVKNIAHISTHAFNSFSQNGSSNSISHLGDQPKKVNENQSLKNSNLTFKNRNPNYNLNRPQKNENNQGQIQINKIAVPHSSFVNSQGQKMRCVYVKSTSTLPYVINTPTQTIANNSDLRYVLTTQPQMKKSSIQMPAITALKNLTKNIQPQTLMLPKNAKLVTVAQKVQTPSMLQNVQNVKAKDNNLRHNMYKSSLLNMAKRTYIPSNIFPENPIYSCLDCNDKFLFQSSLSNHLERRSMSIRYWCICCKTSLQFYNKCSLSIHLRGHSMSMKQIDLSSIGITPIPTEMIEKGIISKFFMDRDSNLSMSVKPTLNDKVNLNTNVSMLKHVATISNNKITPVAGQSKSVSYSSLNASELEKASTSTSQPQTKVLPLILPKPSKPVALVSTSPAQNQNIELPPLSNTSQKKGLNVSIVFCKKLPQSQNIMVNSGGSTEPPNVSSKTDSILKSSLSVNDSDNNDMVIDDDASVMKDNIEEEELVDVENIDGSVTSSIISSSKISEQEKEANGKGKKSSTIVNKRICSECKSYYPNVMRHLNGSGRPTRLDLACKICNLILPSKCALKIHHRIHMKIPPYKCPDCGKNCESWEELHAHLKFSCGHFAKCVRYICKGCKAHFPTKNALAQHIVKNHGKDIFKCSLCPVAFYKKPSLMKHISNDHPNEANKSNIGLDYKQCDMCPKKLLPEESYIVHAKEHTDLMIYGYKCSMCNIIYANKMAFIIHQIKEKTKKGCSDKAGSPKEELVQEAMQVSDSNSDLEDEPLIIRRYPENDNNSPVAEEKDPLSLDDWECTQEQKVKEKTEELCIVCKKNSVVLLPGIDLNRQSLCCKQCVKPLDDDSSTESIIDVSRTNAKMLPKPKNKQYPTKSIYRSSSTDRVKSVTKKRRTSDISLSSPVVNVLSPNTFADLPLKKKSRKKQKDKLSIKDQSHIQGQEIKSRLHNEFSYMCSKCEFVSEEREPFLEHITVHRTDPNTYQCLECGLCFVVLPSLEMHLQMHHGIKDVSSYTEKNKASLPQKGNSSVEEETLENQCRVCHEIFDCKTSLDKHFRIHGMAFMSRLSKSP